MAQGAPALSRVPTLILFHDYLAQTLSDTLLKYNGLGGGFLAKFWPIARVRRLGAGLNCGRPSQAGQGFGGD